jgi:membrane fusion protein, macrolide-specific efflux system
MQGSIRKGCDSVMLTHDLKKRTVFVLLLLFIFLLSGCSYLLPKEEPVFEPSLVVSPKITYNTIEVIRGDIEKGITFTGTFISINQVNTYFTSINGRVESINVNMGDTVQQGDVLIKLETETLEDNINIQEKNIQKIQLEYDRIKELQKSESGRSYDLERMTIDLEIAQIQLNSLKRELERSILYAPISGKIVFMSKSINLGEYVSPYQYLFTIADLSKLELQYSGGDIRALDFKIGMQIEVTYNNIKYTGEVNYSAVDDPSASLKDRRYTLKISMKDQPADIKPGGIANMKLIQESAKNVLILPKQAVRTFLQRKYVQILEDGMRKERDVETGIESGIQIEITAGLKEGDLVILD